MRERDFVPELCPHPAGPRRTVTNAGLWEFVRVGVWGWKSRLVRFPGWELTRRGSWLQAVKVHTTNTVSHLKAD